MIFDNKKFAFWAFKKFQRFCFDRIAQTHDLYLVLTSRQSLIGLINIDCT